MSKLSEDQRLLKAWAESLLKEEINELQIYKKLGDGKVFVKLIEKVSKHKIKLRIEECFSNARRKANWEIIELHLFKKIGIHEPFDWDKMIPLTQDNIFILLEKVKIGLEQWQTNKKKPKEKNQQEIVTDGSICVQNQPEGITGPSNYIRPQIVMPSYKFESDLFGKMHSDELESASNYDEKPFGLKNMIPYYTKPPTNAKPELCRINQSVQFLEEVRHQPVLCGSRISECGDALFRDLVRTSQSQIL